MGAVGGLGFDKVAQRPKAEKAKIRKVPSMKSHTRFLSGFSKYRAQSEPNTCNFFVEKTCLQSVSSSNSAESNSCDRYTESTPEDNPSTSGSLDPRRSTDPWPGLKLLRSHVLALERLSIRPPFTVIDRRSSNVESSRLFIYILRSGERFAVGVVFLSHLRTLRLLRELILSIFKFTSKASQLGFCEIIPRFPMFDYNLLKLIPGVDQTLREVITQGSNMPLFWSENTSMRSFFQVKKHTINKGKITQVRN